MDTNMKENHIIYQIAISNYILYPDPCIKHFYILSL